MNEIAPGLFLSSARSAQDATLLRRHNIAHIVNVASKLPRLQLADIALIPLHFPHDPSPPELARCVAAAVAAIAKARAANKNVLVQCVAGINRSPAVVIAYLVLELHMSVNDAVALVRKRRRGVRPNATILAFLTQSAVSAGDDDVAD